MKAIKWMIILLLVVFTGCATAPVIGPFSYMTSQSNKRASIRRSAMLSTALKTEEKAKVIQATAFSTNPNEIAVGIGVDVMALISSDYTGGELFKQLGGVLGDLALYTAIGYGVAELDRSSSNSGSGDGHKVTVTGDYNTVNTTQGDGNTSTSDENTSSTGGTSNQDTETEN